VVLYHKPPPGAAEAEREAAEASDMVEHRADNAGGIQLPELMLKIKALREAGLRSEHVAFSFMKRRVQPLMARDTLGYQYTATKTHRGCPATKSMMKTSSIGWEEYLRICHNTLLAQSPSTPRLDRRIRYVVETPALE
jgi:hypothetical protein